MQLAGAEKAPTNYIAFFACRKELWPKFKSNTVFFFLAISQIKQDYSTKIYIEINNDSTTVMSTEKQRNAAGGGSGDFACKG